MERPTSITRRTALKWAGGTLIGAFTSVAGCLGDGGGDGGGAGTTSQPGQSTETGTTGPTPTETTRPETTGTSTAEPTTTETTAGADTTDTGTGDPPTNETTTGPGATTGGGAQAIKLGGKIPGWQGRAPEAIAGETNPTLSLQSGTTYRLTWVNLDGAKHELIIEAANGTELVATESTSKEGATRTVTFTATEQMAQYYCEYHPNSMRGNIQFGRATGPDDTQTTTGTATSSGAGY
jgi:hypothetical protein